MIELLPALAVGFAFGWLLQKAGLSRYERIVNVYRFRDFAVVKFLLSALVAGAIGLRILVLLGLTVSIPTPSTSWTGSLFGGIVFGVGMALSGFCPGTIAAGAGEGRLDYIVPGSLGLVFGAFLFGASYRSLLPLFSRGSISSSTIPAMLEIEPWLVILLLTEFAAGVFYVIARHERARHKD
jgi:uncharacterized membrane protein YedE/YeeE